MSVSMLCHDLNIVWNDFFLSAAILSQAFQMETLIWMFFVFFLLQAILADVEKRGEEAQLELRSKMRHIFTLEDEMEYLERQTQLLHAHCVSLHGSNMELQLCISEDKEKASIVLAEYNTYRKKMEGHRAVVQHAESQTEAHKELEEKRALVQTLTHRKEALRKDLENPNGETMQFAKVGKARKQIQNKRYEAIVKRLLKQQLQVLSCSF
uniref:Uncharacterized protein n=1 Tax=Myripristis murdjan TaxID=586833 RepID=A0A667XLT0_9TELE